MTSTNASAYPQTYPPAYPEVQCDDNDDDRRTARSEQLKEVKNGLAKSRAVKFCPVKFRYPHDG
jgi:hypothetical protein